MKVKELIADLQKCDPDLDVYDVYSEDGGEVSCIGERIKDDDDGCGSLCMLDNGTRYVALSSHH